jgi:hypothetical protein
MMLDPSEGGIHGARAVLTQRTPHMMMLATTNRAAWKISSPAFVFPNQLARLGQEGAVVVIRREGTRGQDFALGVAGLEYVLQREQDGTIVTGLVVLANSQRFLASEKAGLVHERLQGIAPSDGRYGPFWWITSEFLPAAALARDEDAPF